MKAEYGDKNKISAYHLLASIVRNNTYITAQYYIKMKPGWDEKLNRTEEKKRTKKNCQPITGPVSK